MGSFTYSKTVLKGPLKKNTKIGFQDRLSLNAGQMYCRILQGENSAILSTFIKVPFVINILVLSIFEWPLETSFTVHEISTEISCAGPFFASHDPISKGPFASICLDTIFYGESAIPLHLGTH